MPSAAELPAHGAGGYGPPSPQHGTPESTAGTGSEGLPFTPRPGGPLTERMPTMATKKQAAARAKFAKAARAKKKNSKVGRAAAKRGKAKRAN